MSQINPITGSILQTPQVQKQQSSDKDRQIRHAQALQKNSAAREDIFEEQVESPEELTAIHDGDPNKRKKKNPPHPPKPPEAEDQDSDHLDLTA